MSEGVIRWEDPPPAGKGGAPKGKQSMGHELIAAQLRRASGKWALIYAGTAPSITGVASAIKKGHYRPYAPAGTFDAVLRTIGGEGRIYARFVGEAGEPS